MHHHFRLLFLFFRLLIQNLFDSLKAGISSHVLRGQDFCLLEIVERIGVVLHALVDIRNIESCLSIDGVELESLLVMNESIFVIAIVVESARQVEMAFGRCWI